MHLIVASDIFGRTTALDTLVEELVTGSAVPSMSVDVVDPYGEQSLNFIDEAAAYNYFMSQCGIEHYAHAILDRLLVQAEHRRGSSQAEPVVAVGFSVGASAFWHLADRLSQLSVTRLLCFYGSQIRKDTQRSLSLATSLVLPSQESSFSVDELSQTLAGKKNLHLQRSSYAHGFMNKLSPQFNPQGYREYLHFLQGELANVSASFMTTSHGI